MTADRVERQLSLARQGLTPPSQLSARVRARFGASEPPSLVANNGSGAALRQRWRALRASGSVGLTVGAGLFAMGCIAGLLGSRLVTPTRDEPVSGAPLYAHDLPVPSASPDAAAAPSHPERAPLTPARPPAERAPEIPAVRSSTPRAPAAGAPPRPSGPRPGPRAAPPRDWRGELELLERAERAIRADNVALALALLGDFDERYPQSRLIEERAAVETMAYCRAAATDSGARAARFLNDHPSSLYRTRVEALCPPATRAPKALLTR
jgi:hypothetical protein